MNHEITKILETQLKIKPKNFPSVAHILEKISFKSGQPVLKKDAISDKIYFITKGLVRVFKYENGLEKTSWILHENDFVYSIKSFENESPTQFIIETLEDSECYFIKKKFLTTLIENHPEVNSIMVNILKKYGLMAESRYELLQIKKPKERYLKFVENNSNLLQRVKLKHIASYLGMTPPQLSRIRKQLTIKT